MYKVKNNAQEFSGINDFSTILKKFMPHAKKYLGFDKPINIELVSDPENAKDPFGKTAYYSPNDMKITLFVDKRHVKDILRSLSHELVHHAQHCSGKFKDIPNTGPGYAQKDPHLRDMEGEAYKHGNGLMWRDFEDSWKEKRLMNEKKAYLHSKKLKEYHIMMSEEEISNFVDNLIVEALDEGDCPTHGKRVDENEEESGGCETKIGKEGYKHELKWYNSMECLLSNPRNKKWKAATGPDDPSCFEGDICIKKEIGKDSDGEPRYEFKNIKKSRRPANEAEGETGDANPLGGKRREFDNDLDGIPDGADANSNDPEVGAKKKNNESWFKGNKDKLIFERLKEKWCK